MAKVKLLEESRKDIFLVDVRALDIDPEFNKRTDYGDIKELATEILENGVLVPLKGRRSKEDKGRYIIVQGHRRHRACMLLLDEGKVKELRVPILLEGKDVSPEDRLVDMILGNDGKPLNILEQAEVIKSLINYGLDEKMIAKRLAKPVAFVANCQLILSVPTNIKNMIRDGKISPTLVINLMKKEKDFDKVVKTITDLNDKIGADGTAQRITAKTVDKASGKVNSVSIFKKILKTKTPKLIREENRPLWEFAWKLYRGEFSKEQLEEMFFIDSVPSVNEDAKSEETIGAQHIEETAHEN